MGEEEKKKMDLWNRRMKTDPRHTKHVAQRGGFTAVDAQYQLMCATGEWGPYGSTWGVRDCKYGLIGPQDEPVEIYLDAVFWYPGGEFPLGTDMAYAPARDCRKRLLTDLTTKALSKLGFNSDVFMGRFDGNKYLWDEEGNYRKDAPVEASNTRAVPERGEASAPNPGLTEKKNELIAYVADWIGTDAKGAIGGIKQIIDALGIKNGGALDEKGVTVIHEWCKMHRTAERSFEDALKGEAK